MSVTAKGITVCQQVVNIGFCVAALGTTATAATSGAPTAAAAIPATGTTTSGSALPG